MLTNPLQGVAQQLRNSARLGIWLRIDRPDLDNFRFFASTTNRKLILPLRTEGVVIMLWPITDRSSATDVPDNDHPAL